VMGSLPVIVLGTADGLSSRNFLNTLNSRKADDNEISSQSKLERITRNCIKGYIPKNLFSSEEGTVLKKRRIGSGKIDEFSQQCFLFNV
jgi:hypothetical protein